MVVTENPDRKKKKEFGVSLKFRFVEVAEYSEVLNTPNNFFESDFRKRWINILPYPEGIENDEWYDAYIYLKEKFL